LAAELILGKGKMDALGHTKANNFRETINNLGLGAKLRLFSLHKKTQKYIDLLVDVQGHQILFNGIFNGDPHPGNVSEN
jgi:hypothetical protein